MPALDTPRVTATKLFSDRLLVALAASDPLATARKLNPAALAERTLLFLPRRAAPALHGRVLRDLARAGVVPRHVRDVRRLRAVFALVACGAGFGLAPRSTVATAAPGLVFRPLARFALQIERSSSPARASIPLTCEHLSTARVDNSPSRAGLAGVPSGCVLSVRD